MAYERITVHFDMDDDALAKLERFRVRHRFKDLAEAITQATQAAVSAEDAKVLSYQFHGDKTITITKVF